VAFYQIQFHDFIIFLTKCIKKLRLLSIYLDWLAVDSLILLIIFSSI
ncbi:MAG: hypothetical protein RI984_959, partial [Pseudomonadota bacterium]